jgi:folate-binding Fe-S cluster repair protein YgfZ
MSKPRLFDRAIIRLSPTEEGEDVRGFLQGLVTQDMSATFPLWAALLTPQGKALFDSCGAILRQKLPQIY